jgi:hypothetical protein
MSGFGKARPGRPKFLMSRTGSGPGAIFRDFWTAAYKAIDD